MSKYQHTIPKQRQIELGTKLINQSKREATRVDTRGGAQDRTLKDGGIGAPESEGKPSRDPPRAGAADLTRVENAIEEFLPSCPSSSRLSLEEIAE